jgi:hypothetical protein
MTGTGTTSPLKVREQLAERLRQRRAEIEDALLTRVLSLGELPSMASSEYAQGLRAAAVAALDYGIETIEHGEAWPTPVPPEVSAQARRAARSGVGLDVVLRRYLAGYTVFSDFIVSEAERQRLLAPAELKHLLRSQGALIEQLVRAVAEAHAEESGRRLSGTESRRVESIERLLAGEPLDTANLGYELEVWHVGLVVTGEGASAAVKELARSLDRATLIVHPEKETTWAWLGGMKMVPSSEILAGISARANLGVGIGEPAPGLQGWRLTHRQAAAGLCVAQVGGPPVVRYAEVALLSSVLGDEVLEKSLRQLYLNPLSTSAGDEDLRTVARAYLETGFNISSTAARVGVERHTVSRRLRTVEERLGCPLVSCAPGLSLALHLDDLGKQSMPVVQDGVDKGWW